MAAEQPHAVSTQVAEATVVNTTVSPSRPVIPVVGKVVGILGEKREEKQRAAALQPTLREQASDILLDGLTSIAPEMFIKATNTQGLRIVELPEELPQKYYDKVGKIVDEANGVKAKDEKGKEVKLDKDKWVTAEPLTALADGYWLLCREQAGENPLKPSEFKEMVLEANVQPKVDRFAPRIEGTTEEQEAARYMLEALLACKYIGRSYGHDIAEAIDKDAGRIDRFFGESEKVSFREFVRGIMTNFATNNTKTLSYFDVDSRGASSRRSAEVTLSEEDMPLSEEELNYHVQVLLVRLDEALAPYEDDNDVRTQHDVTSYDVPVPGVRERVNLHRHEDDYDFSKGYGDLHVKRTRVDTVVDDKIDNPVNSSATIQLPEEDTKIEHGVHVKTYPRVDFTAGLNPDIKATGARDNTVGALKTAQQAIESLKSLLQK